jgi:hypothetical protein
MQAIPAARGVRAVLSVRQELRQGFRCKVLFSDWVHLSVKLKIFYLALIMPITCNAENNGLKCAFEIIFRRW